MSKGSAPRKVREDDAYSTNWDKIFGRVGKGRQDLSQDSKDGTQQEAIRGLEEDRKPRGQEDTGAHT